MEHQVASFFPVPVVSMKITKDENEKVKSFFFSNIRGKEYNGKYINDECQSLIHYREVFDEYRKLLWLKEKIKKYSNFVYKNVMNHITDLEVTDAWFNYAKKGSWQYVHNHCNSVISGTLFIDVGEDFLVSSFGANIAKPGGIAMDLHTDQWWLPDPVNRNEKFLPPGSINRKKFNYKINEDILINKDLISRPAVSNVLIMLNGMSKENGGTLIVPGSHLFGRHPDKILDKDVTTISAEGPPGCAIITDGRLWHGTGANITQKNRLALLITFCGPQFRPQENFTLGIRKEVFLQLDDYQKEILRFKVWNGYGRTGNPTDTFLNFKNPEIGELKI